MHLKVIAGISSNIVESMCVHKSMYTHRSTSGRAFILDDKGQLLGTEDPATGNVYGLTKSLLNTEKLVLSDGAVATKSPIYLVLADNLEVDRDGVLLSRDIASAMRTVIRLADAALTIEGADSTEILVAVSVACDGTPITGLLPADFIKKSSLGALEALTAVEVVGTPGTYTLTATVAFTTGTLELRPVDLLSVKAYEAASVPVTVA
jgi:hypothetical protein